MLSQTYRGFTLVELSVVLIILGLLLGSLMPPLTAQLDQRNYNETAQQLNDAREALIGFAVANGRLPRPAASLVDGSEGSSMCSASADAEAACTGWIPWATLGVKKTDAWNKLIRYSVTPAYADSAFILSTQGTKKIKTRSETGAESYIVGSSSACDADHPCSPAVLYSAGKSNWGVREDGFALPDTSPTNADEDTNAAATRVFFARGQSSVPTGGEFDDLVVWIPTAILMNRMVSAQRIP